MSKDSFDMEDLKEKADLSFEAVKDVDTLKKYLEEVTGDKVSLGNFTNKQIRALIKVMGIDKLYLEPSEEVEEDNNACKQIVKVVTTLSKAKEGFGLESLREILISKSRLEGASSKVLRNVEEEAKEVSKEGGD